MKLLKTLLIIMVLCVSCIEDPNAGWRENVNLFIIGVIIYLFFDMCHVFAHDIQIDRLKKRVKELEEQD